MQRVVLLLVHTSSLVSCIPGSSEVVPPSCSCLFFQIRKSKGGNLDPSDVSPEWNSLCPPSEGEDAEGARMRAIKICAVRETFEEAGILLREGEGNEAWKEVKEEDRRVWRDKVSTILEFVPGLQVGRTLGSRSR